MKQEDGSREPSQYIWAETHRSKRIYHSGETIDLPEYGDEVIAGPTSDWMAILGGLMKAVNTGSMVDDAERIAAGILDTERSFLPSKNAGFRIQIDAYLYMAATSPLPEGA